MDRKNENSSAAGRDIPATCPAAIVDIERDVPGKTAEKIWQRQSRSLVAGSFLPCGSARTGENCIDNPHDNSANEERDDHHPEIFQILPITFVNAHAGTAVTTNAIRVKLSGCVTDCDRRVLLLEMCG